MSKRWQLLFLFLAVLLFRTAFGLSQPFFAPDELQTYLLGLKWFCVGGWPYFGPDLIVTETGFYAQIPGPLEAWMVGYPFVLWRSPEAPFLFLNLFSTGALAALAFYIHKRLPSLSFPFIFVWIALLPWNLHESANIINPSYLLFGSVLFFIGFFEAVPELTLGLVPPAVAFALMGFGTFWNMQFHYSWVLMPPFVLWALFRRVRAGQFRFIQDFVSLLLGAAPLAALLVPTFVQYGFSRGAGGMGLSQSFNFGNFKAFFTVLARFLSLPSFEMPRFIGPGTHSRIEFLQKVWWIIPPAVFLIVVGLVQPFILLWVGWLRPLFLRWRGLSGEAKDPKAGAVQGVAFLAFLLVWASFWFTSKGPLAHMYYILLPLLLVFSFYVWDRLKPRKAWRTVAVLCVAANLWFEAGYLREQILHQSLYLDRAKVTRALREKDYRILGERRPGSYY